ncbi:MAG: patatin family protein [Solobacterium sp.]|nr:patatin family protein [Solobacterium sp.]
MEKVGLVLEGGGVRGSFTAGALTWLYDHNITFDYTVGISTGALYLTCFEAGRPDALKDMACIYAADPNNVGLHAFLTEGHYVATKHLAHEDLLQKEHLDVSGIIERDAPMEIGVYDMEKGETVYYPAREMDKELELIRAACSLPIAAEVVEFKGRKFLDGGITKMVPIERALEQGCTRTLVITTKAKDYVRKPSSLIVRILMKIFYHKYPSIEADYKVRHLNYYKQMDIIRQEEEKGNCILICPSENVKVSRWKGDPEKCRHLFELGYQDMEKRKEEILALVHPEKLNVPLMNEKEKVPA